MKSHEIKTNLFSNVLKFFQENFVSGKTPFDQAQVDSARSGIIYQLIAKEETVSSAALQVRCQASMC